MKKTIKIILALFVLCLYATISAGATQSSVNKILEDSREVLILATVSDVSDDYIIAEVYSTVKKPPAYQGKDNALQENLSDTTVSIQKFNYTYCEEHANSYNTPKIGDNIFAGIKRQGEAYKLNSVAYKIDTVDIKTLNFLVPEPMKGQICMYDVASVAYLGASNGMPFKFNLGENAVTVETGAEVLKIFPQSDVELPIKYINSEGVVVTGTDKAEDVINFDPNMPLPEQNLGLYKTLAQGDRWLISVLVIFLGILIGFGGAVAIYKYKHGTPKKEK